jgi:hypothetical protein
MADIVKINTVEVANIVKLNGVESGNFSKVLGQDFVTDYTNTHSLRLYSSNNYYGTYLAALRPYAELGTASDTFFPTTAASWTLSFWIYFESYPNQGGFKGILSRFKTQGTDHFGVSMVYNIGSLGIRRHHTGTANYFRSKGGIFSSSDNQTWVHIAIVNDVSNSSTGMKFYRNGEEKHATNAYTATSVENGLTTNPLSVGKWNYTNQQNLPAAVKIDELAIHHAALDASNIEAMYNSSTNNQSNGVPINLKANSGNYTQASNLAYYWLFNNNGKESVNGTANSVTLYNDVEYSSTSPAGS